MSAGAKAEDMEIVGCDALGEIVWECQLILLTATDAEAGPLLAALRDPERHVMATKTIYIGEVCGPAGGAARTDARKTASRAVLAVSGCDKANVAHVLTSLLQVMSPPPALVLQVGIAGALPAGPERAARVGDLIVAASEVYSDTGTSSPGGWMSAGELGLPMARVDGVETGGSFLFDGALVERAAVVLGGIDWRGTSREAAPPAVLRGPCVTSSLVTGRSDDAELVARRWQALAESMEGAAAAHVCALYKVPFLEVRAISNLVGDRDRAAWSVGGAVETAGQAALALLASVDSLPLGGSHGR